MQSDKLVSQEARDNFQDAINRVQTMSLIHQKMYQNENLSKIDLPEYVESLCNDILRINNTHRLVEKELHINFGDVGTKTIVPLGLIITELISNSVKHAFDTIQKPRICLSVECDPKSGDILFYYEDNGKWKTPEKESFGIQLIDTFTEQLEGHYTFSAEGGSTSYDFRLQNLDQ